MKHFCIILTQEGRVRFRFLRKEHGLLHEKNEKRSYAVIREAYPTNWPGKWSRAYVIQETLSQTVTVGDKEYPIHGGTVQVIEPLNMVAKIRLPGPRGDNGEVRDVHLTAESIYDRTLSAQVRRLGNRRFQWFHALLFVALGVTIGLFLAGAIALMGSGDDVPTATPTPLLVGSDGTSASPSEVHVGGGRAAGAEQSGPIGGTPSDH